MSNHIYFHHAITGAAKQLVRLALPLSLTDMPIKILALPADPTFGGHTYRMSTRKYHLIFNPHINIPIFSAAFFYRASFDPPVLVLQTSYMNAPTNFSPHKRRKGEKRWQAQERGEPAAKLNGPGIS